MGKSNNISRKHDHISEILPTLSNDITYIVEIWNYDASHIVCSSTKLIKAITEYNYYCEHSNDDTVVELSLWIDGSKISLYDNG